MTFDELKNELENLKDELDKELDEDTIPANKTSWIANFQREFPTSLAK